MPNSYTRLHFHVVFSTKNRLPQIAPSIRARLHEYMGGIVRQHKGRLLAAGGTPDHMHLLTSLHATTPVADMLRLIKCNSSGWVHDTFPQMNDFGWQDGYGAFAVSYSNLAEVEQYIAQQEEHHRRRTFQEEFIEFLERHELSYDPRYLWQ